MSSGVRSVLVPARVDLRRTGKLCDVEALARLRMLSRVLQVQEQLLTAIWEHRSDAGGVGDNHDDRDDYAYHHDHHHDDDDADGDDDSDTATTTTTTT